MKLTKTILSALAAAPALGMKLRHAESSYVSVSGTQFTIDGETGYFAGTNCYWCSFLTQHADVDSTLDHIAASGLRVLRVWGFNDVTSRPSAGTVWFQLLSSSGSTINTGADGLQTLDYLVQAAEARGIKLIIPFVNNWGDYGGMAAYVAAFGGSQTGWYTNAAAQQQYRAFIAAVVGRYSKSTAIFAWELANEPRCNGCDTGVVYQWAAGVSEYIKQLDPNHLVTLGTEGFGLDAGDGSYPYTYYEGTDFAWYLNISTLDFGTFHLYPNSWGTSYDWGNGWIQTHGQACEAAGKPCMLEEYGAPYDHCSIEAPWQSTSLASRGMAADLFWQWGDTLSTGQSQSDDNSVFYQTSDWQCLVQNHVAAVAAAA